MRIAIALTCTVLAFGSAAAQTADDALIGVWGYHDEFPVGPSGTLTITRDGTHWHAAIAGESADAKLSDGDLRFAFPGGDGFRGHMKGRALEGFWARRAITDDPRYPSGSTQGYAEPLAFTAQGANAWRATVTPLSDPLTLYLKIARDKDGKLVGSFRDPEQNSHGPAMQLDLAHDGDKLRFSAKPDPDKPDVVTLEATQSSDDIGMEWRDFGRTISFKRLTPAQAQNFFPRPPGSAPYAYREPEATGDGWTTARAGSLGFDEAALAQVVQKIINVDPAGRSHNFLIHSVAVAYRGKLVLDEYFYGFDRDTPHDTRSASKTFASVMVGTAQQHGIKLTPETPAYALLAPLGPFANPDPLKAQITAGDLMTHTSGLACDDNDEKSPGNEDTMENQRLQPDWWKYTLDLPVAYPPGTHFAYCSANINLVGASVTTATKTWLPEWFDLTVAKPLQFGPYHWNLMPNGEGYAGGGVFVRTRDFLKLGQAFLDGGVWNGRRIVSADWTKLSTAPHRRISPETTGRYGDDFNSVYGEGYDGYAWHLADVTSGTKTFHTYFANGNGGQLLLVVPELDLAVMFTAGNYQQGLWVYLKDAVVGNGIIPALKR